MKPQPFKTNFTGEVIPGSARMPLDTIGQATTSVPKCTEIITYCGGPKCPQSSQAAQRLRELGYTNVRAYEEGLEGWKAAGYSVETLRRASTSGLIGRRGRWFCRNLFRLQGRSMIRMGDTYRRPPPDLTPTTIPYRRTTAPSSPLEFMRRRTRVELPSRASVGSE